MSSKDKKGKTKIVEDKVCIAPPEKRPVYIALQANISSFGLFFPILGGFILSFSNYTTIYVISILMLFIGIFYVSKSEK